MKDDLPVKDWFRLRGMEMTRIEAFTDAAFAFALTLLVMTSTPPASIEALKEMLRDIPVFIFAAANLMVFWHGHNEWSRRYGLDDFKTMLLSIALVSTILIYVYPLRFIGNLFVNFLALVTRLPMGHPPTGVFKPEVHINQAFAIYAAGFVANGIVLVLLNLHAYSQREALELNEIEKHITVSEMGAWVILCAVGTVSFLIAVLLPEKIGAPGFVYMLLPVVMPIYGTIMGRRRRKFEDPVAAIA